MSPLVVQTNIPGKVIHPTDVSAYSTLSIPPYWRGVNFLASNLASFPRSIRKDGVKLEKPHRLDKVLKRAPNNYQNASTFWTTLLFHAVHYRNGYAQIKGSVVSPMLHLLEPDNVMPFRITYDDGIVEQYYLLRKDNTVLESKDVVHLTGLSHDGMAGIDIQQLHKNTFQRAHSLIQYQTRYIQSGTIIRGSVEIPYEATEEQVQQLHDLIKTHYRGSNASDDVLVLSGGAKLNNATMSPQESQLSEQESATAKQVAQVLGIHPFFLYDDPDGKYNTNPEQAGIEVVRYTFRPWIELIQDELTSKLLSENEQNEGFSIRLNPDALMRGDTEGVSTVILNEVKGGLRTANEGRSVLDLPPSDDPEANKLKMLGDTTPQASREGPADAPEAKPSPESQPDAPDKAFAALRPVIDDAIAKVEAYTASRFEKCEKTEGERVIWANVFAQQQAKHLSDTLAPISDALVALGEQPLPISTLAETYAARIRRKAATGDDTNLKQLLFGET